MVWTQAAFITSFDAQAGDVASLATTAQKTLWFNEGQARLGQYRERKDATGLSWTAGDTTHALPSDFAQIEKIVYDDGVTAEEWQVYGGALYIFDEDGAYATGTAALYYRAYFPDLSASQDSLLDATQDYACLYYALYRFYRLLSSNRAYYKRYATMVGANAVNQADLQAEADRYYQDYLEARGDVVPDVPVGFYRS